MKIKRYGIMLVLSSPSGAGKSSVAKQLLNQTENLKMSISATTRLKRKNEIEGQDYFFVSEKEFVNKQKSGFFLESANVFFVFIKRFCKQMSTHTICNKI